MGVGPAVPINVDKQALIDHEQDPFFSVFVDALSSKIVHFIQSNSGVATTLVEEARGPSSGIGGNVQLGPNGQLPLSSTLASQLANLTKGASIQDGLKFLRKSENLSVARIDLEDEDDSGAGEFSPTTTNTSAAATTRSGSVSSGLKAKTTAEENALCRARAFNLFTGNSKRYMTKLLGHLMSYLSDDNTDCDVLLVKGLKRRVVLTEAV